MDTIRGETERRLLVIASTFPAHPGDGTPSFVADLANFCTSSFRTVALVPRVRSAPLRDRWGALRIERFRYFFARRERLADGAIIENIHDDRRTLLQVPPFIVAQALALRRSIRELQPDVVHVHWIVPQGVAALLVARHLPWVVTTLGGDVYALRGPVWRSLERRVLSRAHSITTMNDDMRDRLIALGAEPSRTHILPLPPDLTELERIEGTVERIPGRILFAGRLVEKKGAAVLLDALAALPREPSWSLDLIGDGPLRMELEARAGDLPVRFLGQRSRVELARAMREAEIFVLPSVTASSGDRDGLPVVLLEAMAAGPAIIASRMSGVEDAITDGTSGLLVAPGEPAALRDALLRLLQDRPARGSMGAAAEQAVERYRMEEVGPRFVALLHAAAASRRRPLRRSKRRA